MGASLASWIASIVPEAQVRVQDLDRCYNNLLDAFEQSTRRSCSRNATVGDEVEDENEGVSWFQSRR